MRIALFAAAMAASVTLGGAAAFVDLGPPHISITHAADAPVAMCETVEFNIYFEQGKAKLTAPAERTLDLVSAQIRGCAIPSLSFAVAANTITTAKGRKVAGERSAAVLKALQVRGVTPTLVIVAAVGSPQALISAMPEHIMIAIDASRGPLADERVAAHAINEI